MKFKKMITIAAAIGALSISGCAQNSTNEKKDGTFNVYASVYDYGARVDKVMIESPVTLNGDSIKKDTFTVTTNNKSTAGIDYENGERTVEKVYVSDKNGKKADEGKYVVVELETNLNTEYSDVLQWNDDTFSNVPLEVEYKVKQNKDVETKDGKKVELKLSQDKFVQNIVDEFDSGESKDGIHYRDYKPKADGKKHPLVIWFHGAGEGGENNVTQINGNRGAVAFTTDEAKEIFDNPYVLAPQSPDYWMPEFAVGDLVLKGTDNTDKVVSLIKEYIAEHDDIDENRVYIGGCSMGGYQTWETLFAAPELFAGAFPICAAYDVPTENMDKVKEIPMWLMHAAIDDTVPVQYSRNAYKHMQELGANVLYTEYPEVKVEGQDFESHAVWVYPLNNEATTEDGTTFFEWLASQHK